MERKSKCSGQPFPWEADVENPGSDGGVDFYRLISRVLNNLMIRWSPATKVHAQLTQFQAPTDVVTDGIFVPGPWQTQLALFQLFNFNFNLFKQRKFIPMRRPSWL